MKRLTPKRWLDLCHSLELRAVTNDALNGYSAVRDPTVKSIRQGALVVAGHGIFLRPRFRLRSMFPNPRELSVEISERSRWRRPIGVGPHTDLTDALLKRFRIQVNRDGYGGVLHDDVELTRLVDVGGRPRIYTTKRSATPESQVPPLPEHYSLLEMTLRSSWSPIADLKSCIDVFVDILCRLTLDSASDEEEYLIRTIRRTPTFAISPLGNITWWDGRRVRERATQRLARLHTQKAQAALVLALQEPDPYVRLNALGGLSPKDERAVEMGVRALSWSVVSPSSPFDPRLRVFLDDAGCRRDVELFTEVMDGSNGAVQETRNRRRRPNLEAALIDVVKRGFDGGLVRAANALALLDVRKAIPAIEDATRRTATTEQREALEAAIAKLKDFERLPRPANNAKQTATLPVPAEAAEVDRERLPRGAEEPE